MAVPAAVLSVLVQANTGGATRGLMRFNQQLGGTETKANQATRALATFAKVGVIGTGIGLGYAVSKAADFEEQMDSLGSVTKASGKEMERFRKQAMKAGADTKFSALDAAEAQTELAKGGLKVRQIMRGGLKSALALAAAGEMELGEAAKTTANALNLFGLEGEKSMKVADALAKAANATTADVTDFAMALRQSGGVAKTAGLSFTETVLALEALANAGTKNSDAGTSLKTALLQLIGPTEKQQKLQDKLGLSFIDSSGGMKSMSDISKMLRGSLDGMGAAQRAATLKVLAGTDGVRTLTALYDAGPKKLDKWKKGLEESGTAAEVAARKQSNLKGRLENLQGSVETIAIAVGMKLIPQLTKYAEQLTDILNNTKLSGSEKVGRVAELLAEAIGKGIAAAGTAAAKAAPHVAWAFVKAFMDADAWGKLAIGGAGAFLLKKLGVGAGIGKLLGRGGGGGLTSGILKSAKPIPVFVTNPGGIGGKGPGGTPTPVGAPAAGGKLRKIGGKVVRAIPGLGGVVIAIEVANAAGVKLPNKNLPTRGSEAMDTRGRTPSGQGGRMMVPGGPVRTPGPTSNNRPDEARTASGLAKAKDALAAAARLRKTVVSVNEDIQRLRAMSGRSLSDLSDSAVKNFRRIRETIGLNTKEGRQAADRNFKAISTAVAASMNKGKTSTNAGMSAIEKQLKVHSRQGKEGLSRNFTQAIDAVKGQMRRGGRVTAEGLSVIKSLMVSELKAYGISGKEALRIVKQGGSRDDNFRLAGHQRGGPINVGAPSGDTVPAMLERGEYVVNRNAVKKVGRKALDRINFGMAPRFQKGGFAGMISAANQVDQAQFPYSWGGGHSATPAPFGPFDCSGAVSYVLQKGGVKIPTMVSGSMMGIGKPGAGQVTVYANPGHVFMSILGKFFGTSGSNPGGGAGWFPDPGDSYKSGFTKRHFGTDDIGSAMGTMGKIPRVEVGGPDSLLKSTVQGALDLSRAGANKKLGELAAPIGAGQTGDPGPVGSWSGGSTRAFAVKLAKKAGIPWDPDTASGYRSPADNARVGGSPTSMHMNGTVANPGAWDVAVDAYGPLSANGDRLAALGRAARLAEVIWRAPDHYDHVHLGFFQKGGFLQNLLRGGPVEGLAGLNRRFPKHGLADKAGKFRMTERGVRAVAEAAGFNPGLAMQMAQIAHGESDFYPGIVGNDPGGSHGWGLTQITPEVQGALGKSWINAEGGVANMLNPIANMKVAKKFYENGGFSPWYGTRYLNRNLDTSSVESVLKGRSVGSGRGGGEPRTDPLTDRQRRQLRTPLKGPLGRVFGKTLKVLRSGKPAKFRSERLKQLEKRIKKVSGAIPDSLQKQITSLTNDAAVYDEYATRASSLTGDEEGAPLGVVGGKNESQWLQAELGKLFTLRNKLIEAQQIIEKRRKMIADLIERAQKRLKAIAKQIKANEDRIKQLKRGGEGPRQKKMIARLTQNTKGLKQEQTGLKDKLIPVLRGKRTSLVTAKDNLRDPLETVQGIGSPMKRLKALPALGVLGGSIFDVQMRLRDLAAPKTPITDGSEDQSERADLLAQLLRESNLRTAVSQKQYDVFKNFPAYGGEFATGGVVPGPIGAARTIIAHGGETVTPPGNGGGANVQINFGPAMAWLDDYIEVKVDGVTRKQARNANRMLPGRGGGI